MKKIISFTIEKELISWLDLYSKENPKYRNKSHLIEIALLKLKDEEENGNRQGTQKIHAPEKLIHKRK